MLKNLSNAKMYDLSHAFCGTPVDVADFRKRPKFYEAYDSLKCNADIILTRSCNGSNLLILDHDKYNSKMLQILSTNSKFIKLRSASKLDFTAKSELAFQQKPPKYINQGHILKFIYGLIRTNKSQ